KFCGSNRIRAASKNWELVLLERGTRPRDIFVGVRAASEQESMIVTGVPSVPVRDALVLAAGNGDRFHNGSRQSKLLQPILGEPIILRTLRSARAAGITHVDVVLGYPSVPL